MYSKSESEAKAPTVSPWGALFRVFTEPDGTFASLRDRPKFPMFPAYLAGMLLGGIGIYLTVPMVLDVLSQNPQPGVPQGMLEVITVGSLILTAVATPWLAGLVTAAIAAFLGQFAGSGVGFRAYFGMVGYARLPLALSSVLTGLVAARAGSAAAMEQVSLSPAIFFPDAPVFLKTVLSTLNPFTIWYYILLAIGFGTLHRTKPSRGLWLVLILYLLSLGFTLAGVAMGSAFTQGM